jgi:polyhydroxybutyrate depolymerase
MKRLIAAVVCELVLLAAPAFAALRPADDCLPVRTANAEAACYAMDFGGRHRTFRLYAAAHGDSAVPLILVLHGGGGSGGGMEWLTERGFNRLADQHGAVIVYPDGIGKSWNDGRTDTNSTAAKDQIDDLGWLRALPREIGKQFPIDAARVYATGISNGGLMSYRLACDAADVFAALAPVAANMSVDLAPRCSPSRPVPIAIINGTDDPIMPWQGGAVKVLWFKRGSVLSTADTVARWVDLDHCAAPSQSSAPVDQIADDGTALVLHTAACAGNAEVRLYEIRGGGHTWPRGEPYLGERLVGRVSRELDANVVIWEFFTQHPLR